VTDELDRIARAAVPEVLGAALEVARERAVARLADLLADAIVAQALTGAVPVRAPDPPPPAADGARDGQALYAYGITTADLAPPDDVGSLTGGATLGQVTSGDLALLVSAVRPDELRIDEDDLSETGRLATLARGHDAVVRAAALRGPVLPLRFGTVVPDEAAARRLLDEHGDAARERLQRIDDSREWGVKLVRRLDVDPVPVGPRPSERAGVTGTEYLARRRQVLAQADRAEAAAEKAADLLLDVLRPHVTEVLRRGGSPGSSLLLDLAFLVGPDTEAGFLAAAAELRERLEPDGLEVEVSGPWPPYSFASLEDGDA
jgi:Gas vesicle synthesis protein GvpL/GvpF